MGIVLNPAHQRRASPLPFLFSTLKVRRSSLHTLFKTPEAYQLPTQASRPLHSDKAQWFADWRLAENE